MFADYDNKQKETKTKPKILPNGKKIEGRAACVCAEPDAICLLLIRASFFDENGDPTNCDDGQAWVNWVAAFLESDNT